MRLIRNPQTTFAFQHTRTSSREQWQKIDEILRANPAIAELAWQDLNRTKDGRPKSSAGAKGMTADQVLRFAIVKAREGLAYRKLADRVDDSVVLREFCLIPFEEIPAFTALHANITRLTAQTLARINDAIVDYAAGQKVEDGKGVRIDSTAVEANIHPPCDSAQLWDCVRVLTRILRRAEAEFERLRGRFSDHTRVVKSLRYKMNNTRGEGKRKPLYKRMLAYTAKTLGYADEAIAELAPMPGDTFEELLLKGELRGALEEFAPLARRVIDQTQRRVLKGESVPAADKVVSIFEPHADIIVKGQRDVVFGHKVFLATGKSNLIVDCVVEEGNPADSEQLMPALERIRQRFGKAPKDLAADGGFASKKNGRAARELGVQNVAFSTLKGNTLSELVRSARAYKMLCKWRAGIEGIISTAKRAFGLDRCNWRGYESFQAYVHLGVVAFNLQTLARHLL